MRQFLLETYAHALPPRSTILDVAGGSGTLSWLLLNVDGYDAVVVDPRPCTNHKSLERSVRYLKDHPAVTKERSVRGAPTHQPLACLVDGIVESEMRSPVHLRVAVDEGMVDAVGDLSTWMRYWEETGCSSSSSRARTAAEAYELITTASLIVGFHPDQATEACIDLAKKLKVPFAVCPCCVFPSEFSWRRLKKDGRAVKKYWDLVDYLKEKCENWGLACRVEELTFFDAEMAKNVVLYTLPGDWD